MNAVLIYLLCIQNQRNCSCDQLSMKAKWAIKTLGMTNINTIVTNITHTDCIVLAVHYWLLNIRPCRPPSSIVHQNVTIIAVLHSNIDVHEGATFKNVNDMSITSLLKIQALSSVLVNSHIINDDAY
jgi:hypothetical protein